VILEPFWNPFVEEQAIDRVHRLTQTVDVIVYKLTVENTVEERILELQEKKRLLAATAIESGAKKEGLKLGLNEMLELFKHMSSGAGGQDDDGRRRYHTESANDRIIRDDVLYSAQSMRSNKSKAKTNQESNVWGRRW
jgi:hypothetical protein